ncbi:flagellar motor switch protein FliG [Gammaproteobacteria bacterium 54_18_T64]|mgnify:FL=1|nr:flagellar motor switch protein FliG [Gammaproteobacteria bacterium 54_18_T64]
MADKAEALKGVEKAAVFLLGVGEQSAAQILRHMAPKEVHKIGAAMATLRTVSRQQAEEVIGQFTESLGEATSFSGDNEDFVRSVLKDALGEDKAEGVINTVIEGRDSKGVESLKWMDSRAVAAIIRGEHPQIIAIVLAYLDSEQSAEVIKHLPEKIRKDAVVRIAQLDAIHPSALLELDEILERQFSDGSLAQASAVGGLQSTADILSYIDSELESELIEAIQEVDQDMSDKVRDLMFVFDNLLDVEDRGIQRLLREVSSDVLVIALKGADSPVRKKIFGNMSKRAAEMMEEDLETRGPVRLSEVEDSQKEILAVAQRLAEEGEITLGGTGGDEFV